jgi:hypothetical protein
MEISTTVDAVIALVTTIASARARVGASARRLAAARKM